MTARWPPRGAPCWSPGTSRRGSRASSRATSASRSQIRLSARAEPVAALEADRQPELLELADVGLEGEPFLLQVWGEVGGSGARVVVDELEGLGGPRAHLGEPGRERIQVFGVLAEGDPRVFAAELELHAIQLALRSESLDQRIAAGLAGLAGVVLGDGGLVDGGDGADVQDALGGPQRAAR